jgi:hypothetical protein
MVRNCILKNMNEKCMNHNPSLGIKASTSSASRNTKEGKKRGRRSNQQLIKDLGDFLVNSGQISFMTDTFQPNPRLLHEISLLEHKRLQLEDQTMASQATYFFRKPYFFYDSRNQVLAPPSPNTCISDLAILPCYSSRHPRIYRRTIPLMESL